MLPLLPPPPHPPPPSRWHQRGEGEHCFQSTLPPLAASSCPFFPRLPALLPLLLRVPYRTLSCTSNNRAPGHTYLIHLAYLPTVSTYLGDLGPN